MRRILPIVAACALAMLSALAFRVASAPAETDALRDRRADTRALKRKPEIDIARVSAADEAGKRVKFKISMHGRLTPGRRNTQPFILINTAGGSASRFEYLVYGPRVFEVRGEDYVKVGANRILAKRSTWVYRWKPASIGLRDGDVFGWAALTAKGNTADLAPDDRYRKFRIRTVPPA